MEPSLRSLLTGIIDYAGLFPPAKLPLDQALGNYARDRQDKDGWMLGRFVMPASRLRELRPFRSTLFASGPPLPLSVLGRGGSADDFLEGFTLDLEAIASCRAEQGDRVSISILETRLPDAPVTIDLLGEVTEQAEQLELFPFFEIGLKGNWRETVAQATQTCAAVGLMAGATGARAGLKLRCGGLEASAFPSVEQVAEVIEECVVARVPLKFTAGLHHPLRHFDKSVKAYAHGFLNVFVAGVLTTEHRLAEPTLRELLLEEQPQAFLWTSEAIGWREWSVRTAEVELARRYSVTSFGSCSFDEPRADLRKLGWLRTESDR